MQRSYVHDLILVASLAAAVGVAVLLVKRRQAPPPKEEPAVTGRAPVETAFARRAAGRPDDPAAAGWNTEALHDAMAARLDKIGAALEHGGHPPEGSLAALLTNDVSCDALRPSPRREVFRDAALTVERADLPLPPEGGHGTPGPNRGAAALEAQVAELAGAFAGTTDVHAKFKVYRIEASQESLRTVANVQVRGSGGTEGRKGGRQVTATWHISWQFGPDGAPLIERIRVAEHEESEAAGPLFVDDSQAVMGALPAWREQLRAGTDEWMERIDASFPVALFGHQGLAVGDANGDGLDDVYVCQPGGLPNRLLLQQPDGSVTDGSTAAGVDLLDLTRSALFVDLDNDGDQDLVVATLAAVVLFDNQGGRFVERARSPAIDPTSLAAADIDLDGDLDLYACEYAADTATTNDLPTPVPFYDANNGGRNVLLRNEGGWRFADATRAVGLEANNTRFSFAASFEDYDDDGDPDLYVANDFGRNNLYRNDRGHFTDVAAEAGVEDIGSGMSVSWGDYDGDGKLDLHVGNMWSSAGGRISTQERFRLGHSDDVVGSLRRFARGNSLYRNLGGGRFGDVSEAAGVELGRWAWGSIFTDVNNDGLEDLVVVNGFVSRPGKPDL